LENELMPFVKAALLTEVPPGTAKQVIINGRKVGLYNRDGKVFALDDTCPHRGAPLSEGECDETSVVCPWHGAAFDLATGAVQSPPAKTGVAALAVQIVDSEIQVEVS
jgi:nitrite reductase/ring-hydroxylating ferredoxin subunit